VFQKLARWYPLVGCRTGDIDMAVAFSARTIARNHRVALPSMAAPAA